MGSKIVILGGGTGGTMVANHLAKGLQNEIKKGDVKITMVTQSEKHIYQPGYLFVTFAHEEPEHYVQEQKNLIHSDIELIITEATKIDKANKKISTSNGEISYDYLVIATGSIPRYDLVPGLAEGANNFYSMEGALELRDRLLDFKGGKIVITLGLPHKCPVAPIELFFMLEEYFQNTGIREKVEFVYTYPIEDVHLAPPVAKWLKPQLEKRNMRYVTNFAPGKVDPEKRVLYSTDGKEESYDLLISIPPHRGAEIIFNSEGLGNEQGWIEVNPHTLKAVNDKYIYVVGDATALQISKAGSTAHYESEFIAKNVIAEIHGIQPSHHYNGKVLCFIETGMEEASYITMDYKHPPQPVPPSIMLHWFKIAFNEMYWLSVKGIL